MDSLGASFLPGTDQNTPTVRLPQAQTPIQFLSLQMPRVVGAQALSPQALMTPTPGSAGASSQLASAVVRSVLASLGHQLPSGFGATSLGLPPSGSSGGLNVPSPRALTPTISPVGPPPEPPTTTPPPPTAPPTPPPTTTQPPTTFKVPVPQITPGVGTSGTPPTTPPPGNFAPMIPQTPPSPPFSIPPAVPQLPDYASLLARFAPQSGG